MRPVILFVYALFFSTTLSAQDFLNFPNRTVQALSDLPITACVHHSTQLIESLDKKDISQAEELRLYGHRLLNLGQHEYAKDVFEKVLDLNNTAYGKEDIRYVKALVDLARAYILLIRYTEASGMYKEALTTVKNIKGKNSLEYWTLLNESAMVFTRSRDWSKATALYKEGVGILEKLGKENSIYYAIYQNNLGAASVLKFNYKKALEYYTIAFKVGEKYPRLALSMAANLAEAYAMVGEKEKALSLLKKYKPIATKVLASKDLTFARVWMQYGIAYTALKDYKAADKAFKQALITNSLTFSSIENIPGQADDLMFQNDFLATCGQAGIMMHNVKMYKQIYEETGDVEALQNGYKIIRAMAKYGEQKMNSYLSEENKLVLFRLGADVLFDMSIDFAYEMYQQTKDYAYIEEAFFYSERSKSTLLTNSLRSEESKSLEELPAKLIKEEDYHKAALKRLQREQLEAATKIEKERIQKSINDLNLHIEHFKDKIKKDYPEYYEYRYSVQLSTIKEIQTFLANRNSVLVEYALGLYADYAFVIGKDFVELVKLDVDKRVYQAQTLNLRNTLTNYRFLTKEKEQADALYRDAASYFYQTFIQPLLEQVNDGQHLIIVPDQNLGHLPFETFLTEAPAKKQDYASYPYLIKKYPVSYSYSATILLSHQQKAHRAPKRGVLAFAAEYPTSPNPITYQRGGNLGVVREGLQPLPGAQEEVALMEKYLLGEFYNGATADEETFKATAHNYGVIHLAMHGVLDSKHPILSSLVFSENDSDTEDNFLRAYEIAQMDLNADLVVLSACETGYGKFQQGEGVMSLAHSFAYAGASSVLMSLWKVNDLSTSQIMKNFYINIAKGWTKDKALRQAKLKYLKNNKNKNTVLHPAFWAAFVQTGDVAPLDLLDKCGNTFQQTGLMIAGELLLVLLLVIYGVRRWRASKS